MSRAINRRDRKDEENTNEKSQNHQDIKDNLNVQKNKRKRKDEETDDKEGSQNTKKKAKVTCQKSEKREDNLKVLQIAEKDWLKDLRPRKRSYDFSESISRVKDEDPQSSKIEKRSLKSSSSRERDRKRASPREQHLDRSGEKQIDHGRLGSKVISDKRSGRNRDPTNEKPKEKKFDVDDKDHPHEKKNKHRKIYEQKVNYQKSITLAEAKLKAAEEREKKQQGKVQKKQELERRKIDRECEMTLRRVLRKIDNKAKKERKIERERLRLEKKDKAEKLKRIRQKGRGELEKRRQLIISKAKLENKRRIREAMLKNEKELKNAEEKKAELEKNPYNVLEVEPELEDDYERLAALDDLNLVPNAEVFECTICIENVPIGEGVILHDCLHSYCKVCLAALIEHSDRSYIRCPFKNNEYACESYLQDREIKSLVTPEIYEKYLQRSVAFHCKTHACPGWCLLEDYMNVFLCLLCKRNNCLACAAIHEGMTCQQYQDHVAFSYNVNERENLQNSEFHNTEETDFEAKFEYQVILAASEDVSLVSNVDSFECPICFTNIGNGEGVVLHDCLHSFCKECLAGLIQHSETALVRCPFQNDEYSCESHLQEREIKSLVSPEIYEKHLERSMMLAESQAPNSFHCKTPDCPGWCLYEDYVNIFQCPVCAKNNCLTCAAIHEGKNCKQYQDFVVFNCDTNEEAKRTKKYLQNMLEKGHAMECPKCCVIIIKKDGCDALTCSMCRTEICWVTKQARWGPKGPGDYSGGCKCKYDGKRCHPKCRNCH